MSYHLGVDLGTTFTAAALARDGRAEPVTLGSRSVAVPSVVYMAGENLLFGHPAVTRSVSEATRVAREFKRRVGDPTPLLLDGSPVAADVLMAHLLRWVVGQVATTEGAWPASLAVTHPANWGEYKLDLLRQAIRREGLRADHLVPEPVAAASFYETQRELAAGSVVAVYDLGGGTFDAAVVRASHGGFEILGRPDGIERLGGIDFDHAVLAHVAGALDIDIDTLDSDSPVTAAALDRLAGTALTPRKLCQPRRTSRFRCCYPTYTPRCDLHAGSSRQWSDPPSRKPSWHCNAQSDQPG